MPNVSLETLIADVRELADMENTQFCDDDEITKRINEGCSALYDLIVRTNEDYYTLIQTFSVASGSHAYDFSALSPSVYKIRGVDITLDNGVTWLKVRPFNFLERDKYQNQMSQFCNWYPRVRYRIVAKTLQFLPTEQAPGSYRMWYVPPFAGLSALSDTFDSINGWTKYVALHAAIDCSDKEESDTAALEKKLVREIERITAMAPARDLGEPEKIADTRTRSDRGIDYFDNY